MFYSKNKRLYDLILDKLNENTQDVTFSGNYMFEFNQQLASGNSKNFSIVSRNADSLDFTTTDIVPLVDVQSIQIPFVEKNKRDDWEREFYVAIEIPQGTHTLDKGHAWSCYELCDSLWKAVKEKIELEYNVSD